MQKVSNADQGFLSWDFSRLLKLHLRNHFLKFTNQVTGVSCNDLNSLEILGIFGEQGLVFEKYTPPVISSVGCRTSVSSPLDTHWTRRVGGVHQPCISGWFCAPTVRSVRITAHYGHKHKPMLISILSLLELSFPNMEILTLDFVAKGEDVSLN